MAAPNSRPGRRPPKPVAPARPGAAGPDDTGWVQRSPSITVDHRPKLFLEGFPVEAWIGALQREGLNPGLHGLEEAALPSSFSAISLAARLLRGESLSLMADWYEAELNPMKASPSY